MHYDTITNTIHDRLPRWLTREFGNVVLPDNPTDEMLAEWGVFPMIPFAIPEGHRITGNRRAQWSGTAWLELYDTVDIAAEEQARVAALAQSYGGLVTALNARLSVVGWAIPCEAVAVTTDLITRTMQGELTTEQSLAKSDIANMYAMLQSAGVSDADIAAVWAMVGGAA
jgi:Na+(H+)/acetate symporter ActP